MLEQYILVKEHFSENNKLSSNAQCATTTPKYTVTQICSTIQEFYSSAVEVQLSENHDGRY